MPVVGGPGNITRGADARVLRGQPPSNSRKSRKSEAPRRVPATPPPAPAAATRCPSHKQHTATSSRGAGKWREHHFRGECGLTLSRPSEGRPRHETDPSPAAPAAPSGPGRRGRQRRHPCVGRGGRHGWGSPSAVAHCGSSADYRGVALRGRSGAPLNHSPVLRSSASRELRPATPYCTASCWCRARCRPTRSCPCGGQPKGSTTVRRAALCAIPTRDCPVRHTPTCNARHPSSPRLPVGRGCGWLARPGGGGGRGAAAPGRATCAGRRAAQARRVGGDRRLGLGGRVLQGQNGERARGRREERGCAGAVCLTSSHKRSWWGARAEEVARRFTTATAHAAGRQGGEAPVHGTTCRSRQHLPSRRRGGRTTLRSTLR
jgi:hypothetical protein